MATALQIADGKVHPELDEKRESQTHIASSVGASDTAAGSFSPFLRLLTRSLCTH